MGDVTAFSGIRNQAPQDYGPASANSDKTEPSDGSARGYAPAATVRATRAPQWRQADSK